VAHIGENCRGVLSWEAAILKTEMKRSHTDRTQGNGCEDGR